MSGRTKKCTSPRRVARPATPSIQQQIIRRAIGPAMVMVAWDQAAHAQTYEFNHTGGFQSWTVPVTGVYTITAFGAQGGGAELVRTVGGFGAMVAGEFNLFSGQELSIAVGGQGFSGDWGGGGGGGSFITFAGTPLITAGGGGGGGYYGHGRPGLIGGNGAAGGSGYSPYGSGGLGGTAGDGGSPGSTTGELGSGVDGGGGGGGFFADGLGEHTEGGASFYGGGGGGSGFSAGLSGGRGGTGFSYVAGGGGFGGGGGGGNFSGGGGGGFSGGGGGGYGWGGGGGSFNVGENQSGVAGYQPGNGQVQITLVPEPTSMGLLGLGFTAGAAALGSRRRRSAQEVQTKSERRATHE